MFVMSLFNILLQFGNVEVVLVSLEDSFPKLLRRRKTLLTMLICAMHIPLGLIYCTQVKELIPWSHQVNAKTELCDVS